MELKEHAVTLGYDIAFWTMGLRNPQYPIGQLGDLSETISEKLRAFAIMMLLIDGETDLFLHNLIRSGMARETFLRRARDEGLRDDFHLAISRSTALEDAVAAGATDLAQRIVGLSTEEWVPNGEYEDDFCYRRCLHLFAQGAGAPERIEPVLQRFDEVAGGAAGARLTVCRALAARDQAAFDEAIEARILEYEGMIDEQIERGQMEEAHVVPPRHVFVEGLALLRLADRQGLRTDREYRRCPALARLPMTRPLPPD